MNKFCSLKRLGIFIVGLFTSLVWCSRQVYFLSVCEDPLLVQYRRESKSESLKLIQTYLTAVSRLVRNEDLRKKEEVYNRLIRHPFTLLDSAESYHSLNSSEQIFELQFLEKFRSLVLGNPRIAETIVVDLSASLASHLRSVLANLNDYILSLAEATKPSYYMLHESLLKNSTNENFIWSEEYFVRKNVSFASRIEVVSLQATSFGRVEYLDLGVKEAKEEVKFLILEMGGILHVLSIQTRPDRSVHYRRIDLKTGSTVEHREFEDRHFKFNRGFLLPGESYPVFMKTDKKEEGLNALYRTQIGVSGLLRSTPLYFADRRFSRQKLMSAEDLFEKEILESAQLLKVGSQYFSLPLQDSLSKVVEPIDRNPVLGQSGYSVGNLSLVYPKELVSGAIKLRLFEDNVLVSEVPLKSVRKNKFFFFSDLNLFRGRGGIYGVFLYQGGIKKQNIDTVRTLLVNFSERSVVVLNGAEDFNLVPDFSLRSSQLSSWVFLKRMRQKPAFYNVDELWSKAKGFH